MGENPSHGGQWRCAIQVQEMKSYKVTIELDKDAYKHCVGVARKMKVSLSQYVSLAATERARYTLCSAHGDIVKDLQGICTLYEGLEPYPENLKRDPDGMSPMILSDMLKDIVAALAKANPWRKDLRKILWNQNWKSKRPQEWLSLEAARLHEGKLDISESFNPMVGKFGFPEASE